MLADPVTQGTIAYFSMEIALETGIPTYSGGLGVLAGDTLRAAADLGLPMVGVTLLHRLSRAIRGILKPVASLATPAQRLHWQEAGSTDARGCP